MKPTATHTRRGASRYLGNVSTPKPPPDPNRWDGIIEYGAKIIGYLILGAFILAGLLKIVLELLALAKYVFS